MMTRPTYPILVSAAKLIEEYGWTQGTLVEGSRHCASGAIYRVALNVPPGEGMEGELLFRCPDEAKAAIRALAHAIGDAYEPNQAMLEMIQSSWFDGEITTDDLNLYVDVCKIIAWNDMTERTADDVTELLERVAYGLDGVPHQVRNQVGVTPRA